ncbi:MAG: patatin-like phospholipase family protein [Treponema sp.]|jgi:NTE family protein|nr:patatin-like phospholipase family protein [Treponema sp.]
MRKLLFIFFFFLSLTAYPDNERPRVALVLGGGAARGFAHIAILELIEELEIPVDMIVGVSVGSIVGGLYSSGYSPATIMNVMESRDWSSFFQDNPVLPFTNRHDELPLALGFNISAADITPDFGMGYSSGQKAYELIKSLTAKIPSYYNFDNLPIPFRAGTVAVPEGKFELLDYGDLAEAIRASMSIPGIFEPFAIDGQKYTDGGLLNNVPIQIVREMGFDIVIAVDLFSPLTMFNTNIIDVPDLITNLYLSRTTSDQHEYADVILYPLTTDVPTLNFSKGKEIYAAVMEEREKLLSLLLPVRERIHGSNIEKTDYNDLPSIIPRRMIIAGALNRDNAYIEKEFNRLVKDKELNEENTSAFLDSVYAIGNYRNVQIRIDNRAEESILEVDLYNENKNNILLRGGINYTSTFSSISSYKTAIRGGIEFQGKDGTSVLLGASALDVVSVSLSFLKPISPEFYFLAAADLVRDQEQIEAGFMTSKDISLDYFFYLRAILKGGVHLNRNNTLIAGPEYFMFWYEDNTYTIGDITAAYTYSNIDYNIFPTRGIRIKLANSLRLNFSNDISLFDLAYIDIEAAIPLHYKLSIGFSGFASCALGDSKLPPQISVFGFRNIYRYYFPLASSTITGENQAACSFSFQFEPWRNLSIMGGRLIFLLSASAGGSFNFDHWNGYIGAALVASKSFSLLLRTGVCGNKNNAPSPFLSIDVGLIRF